MKQVDHKADGGGIPGQGRLALPGQEPDCPPKPGLTCSPGELQALTRAVLDFRDARDWAQFHTLRQLIVSLNLEATELLELTQWKGDAEIDGLPGHPELAENLADECADVFCYLLLIAHQSGIDLKQALLAKLEKNARKYPVALARGRRDKYTVLARETAPGGLSEGLPGGGSEAGEAGREDPTP